MGYEPNPNGKRQKQISQHDHLKQSQSMIVARPDRRVKPVLTVWSRATRPRLLILTGGLRGRVVRGHTVLAYGLRLRDPKFSPTTFKDRSSSTRAPRISLR